MSTPTLHLQQLVLNAQARFHRARHRILSLEAQAKIQQTHRVMDHARVNLKDLQSRKVYRQRMLLVSDDEIHTQMNGLWDRIVITHTPVDYGGGFTGSIMGTHVDPTTGKCWYLTGWLWPKEEEFPLHNHPWPEYILLLSGSLAFYFGATLIQLERGSGVFCPPELPHGGISLEETFMLMWMPCDHSFDTLEVVPKENGV